LPSDSYVGGNIRDMKLVDILKTKELTFNLNVGGTKKAQKELWGFCGSCEHRVLCRAGCAWTSHVFFDRRGNNPHCHHRALTLQKRGIRERAEQVEKAPGTPFDNGKFKIVEEPIDAPWPENDPLHFTADKVVWPESWKGWPVF
jgi:radical SAM protein with 4Fe4S-binding SPASM domain